MPSISKFETALKNAYSVFKVSRSEQQFPFIPFVFGAYTLPAPTYPSSHFLSPHQGALKETYNLFMDNYMANKSENMVGFVSNSLIIKCQKSIMRLANSRITMAFRENTREEVFTVIGGREVLGTDLLYPELNIPPDKVLSEVPSLKVVLSEFNKIKRIFFPQDSSLKDFEGFSPEDVIIKKRKGEKLTNRETIHLDNFHKHLADVGIQRSQVLAASRYSKAIVLTNNKHEEIDGEIEPNVHILCFEKYSVARKASQFLGMNFLMDRWILTDIDFLEPETMYS